MKLSHETQYALFNHLPKVEPEYRKHSETSKKAAEKVKHVVNSLHKRIIEYLAANPNHSADEIAEVFGVNFMNARPRMRELFVRGYVFKTGEGKSVFGNDQESYSLTAKGEQLSREIKGEQAG